MTDDQSSHNHALLTSRGKRLMRNVGLCALTVIGVGLLGLTILLGILHPAEVLAVTTAILAAATLVLAVVAVIQRNRKA